MAWATSSGGYPGVTSTALGDLSLHSLVAGGQVAVGAGGSLLVSPAGGPIMLSMHQGFFNDGLKVGHGVGMFDHDPPAAATVGGAATAGGTYTATEEAMLNAVYTALRSIGLIT